MASSSVLARSACWATVEVTDRGPQPRTQRRGHAAPNGAASVASPERFANPFEPGSPSMDTRLGGMVEFGVWFARQRDLLGELRALAGRDFFCGCTLDDSACRRIILLDVANLPTSPFAAAGRAMGLTVCRPWASLLLVPEALGSKNIETRTWSTSYRGPVLIYSGTRIDAMGISAAQHVGLGADWHTQQQGWLGAAVLVDVHPARNFCCRPWGQTTVALRCPVAPLDISQASSVSGADLGPRGRRSATHIVGGSGASQPAGINQTRGGRAHP